MNVWNRVLYCLIAILCVAFGVFAANKYSLTKTKTEELAKLEKQLAETRDAVAKLKAEVYGAPTSYDGDWRSLSMNARLDVLRALKGGETFSNCRPIDAAFDESQTTISFLLPDDYGISSFRPGTIAYVFDSGRPFVAQDGAATDSDAADVEGEGAEVAAAAILPAKFLGAFQVSAANGAQASLVSAEVFTEDESAATAESAQSGRSWIVCLNGAPIDSPNDLAAFAKEDPETFAPYGEELKAYFAKSSVKFASAAAPSAATEADEADEADEAAPSDETAIVALDEIPSETESTRYPVDYLGVYCAIQYQGDAKTLDFTSDYPGVVETQWTRRNAQNVLKTRNEITLARFVDIFFDQLVAIDKDAIDQAVVAKADEKTRALYDQEEFDARYAAAEKRKLSKSYAEQKAELAVDVQRMTAWRDLVKSKLDEARDAVAACQESIEATILQNAELAAKLARAQILVAEKIERESTQTAANDAKYSYQGI